MCCLNKLINGGRVSVPYSEHIRFYSFVPEKVDNLESIIFKNMNTLMKYMKWILRKDILPGNEDKEV